MFAPKRKVLVFGSVRFLGPGVRVLRSKGAIAPRRVGYPPRKCKLKSNTSKKNSSQSEGLVSITKGKTGGGAVKVG
jgi:hypothetical protein